MPEPVAAPLAASTVGIVCALATEARHLLRAAAGRGRSATGASPLALVDGAMADGAITNGAITNGHGRAPPSAITRLPDGTLLIVSGMGSAAAAAAAEALATAGATALMSVGLAGGLDPHLAPGTVFLPSAVMPYDTLSPATAASHPGAIPMPIAVTTPAAPVSIRDRALPTDAAWRQRLSVSLHRLQPLTEGTLLTSQRAIATVGAKAALFHSTAAAAVDMEGFAVAGVALQWRLPFVALKVIVDGAHDALPRCALAATDAAGGVHVGRLLGALVRRPSELAPLLTLARRYRTARSTLAAAATVIVAPGAGPS